MAEKEMIVNSDVLRELGSADGVTFEVHGILEH